MENLKSRSGILEDYLLKNEKNNMSKTVKGNTKNSKFAYWKASSNKGTAVKQKP